MSNHRRSKTKEDVYLFIVSVRLLALTVAMFLVVVGVLAFLDYQLKTYGVVWTAGVDLTVASIVGVMVWLLRSN